MIIGRFRVNGHHNAAMQTQRQVVNETPVKENRLVDAGAAMVIKHQLPRIGIGLRAEILHVVTIAVIDAFGEVIPEIPRNAHGMGVLAAAMLDFSPDLFFIGITQLPEHQLDVAFCKFFSWIHALFVFDDDLW